MNKKTKILIFSIVFLVCGGWRIFSTFYSSEFDPVKWNSPVEKISDCYRGGMAGDISSNVLKIGMSKQEVVNILNYPDKVFDGEYLYLLGFCSGLGIDYDVLHIKFYGDKLISSEIRQH